MLISQKKDIITLIPKKDKNRTLLDNWRPISLLNTDYKVAIKSIAARITKVLPSPKLMTVTCNVCEFKKIVRA